MVGVERNKGGPPAGIGSFRFAEQQMNLFRHHHAASHDEAIALSHLFQNAQEQITPRGSGCRKRSLR